MRTEKYVERPNTPIRAKTIIVGEKYSELEYPLKQLGIETILVPDNPYVDSRLSGHADLSVLHLGGNKMLLAPYLYGSEFAKKLSDRGVSLSFADIEQKEKYPDDAQLNIAIAGRTAFIGRKTIQSETAEFLIKEEYRIIPVNQGYSKCSMCIVDENSVISSDEGICDAARSIGMSAHKIKAGGIELTGFDYGFIGGSCCLISRSELAFTGCIDNLNNHEKIKDFAESRGKSLIFLTNKPVFDVGSLIPIFEY